MPLLSDYESFDRHTEKRCTLAMESTIHPFTIEQACEKLGYPMPISEDELQGFARTCDTWGIRVNVDTEGWWKDLLEKGA